jgi:hypothetical protein
LLSHIKIFIWCEYFNTIQRTILFSLVIMCIDLGVVSHIAMVFYGSQFFGKIVLLSIRYVTDFSVYCEWSTISLQILKSPTCVLLWSLCHGNLLQIHLDFEVTSNHCWFTCIVQDVRLRDCYKKFSLHDIATLSRYARHIFSFFFYSTNCRRLVIVP